MSEEQKCNPWDAVERYVNEYEFRSDGGDYIPSCKERLVILDCIAGLLEDDEFRVAWNLRQPPEGWKLVPVKPTPEMLRVIGWPKYPEDWTAGKLAQNNGANVPPNHKCETAYGVYLRLLAAAPSQKEVK